MSWCHDDIELMIKLTEVKMT